VANLKQTIEFQAKGLAKLKKQYKELEGRTKGLEGATGKAGGGLKGLGKAAGIAGAAFFGGKAIISGLTTSIQLASKFQGVSRGFDNLAKSAGFSGEAFEKFKDATDGTIGSVDLMTQANNAMLLGITDSEDQMAEMFDVAQRLAQGLGKDTAFGIESLVTGLGRQSKLMLDNLGIMIDVNKANDAYAKKLGTTASELTDAQRKQAFVNTAMEEGRKLVEKMGEEQLTMSSSMDQAKAAASDVGIEIGQTLAPAVTTIASGFAGAAASVALYIRELRLSSKDITELMTLEEKEEIVLAKIANTKRQLADLDKSSYTYLINKKNLEYGLTGLQVDLENVRLGNLYEWTDEQAKALELTLKQIEAENTLSEAPKKEPADLGAEDLDEYIRKQQEIVDAKAVESAWLDHIKTEYRTLAEDMGLIPKANEAIILSEEQKVAIQTEFNEKYIEAVRGTYELESAEITNMMERYGEVEKDKTKLTEMETALRTELHIRTAQTVAGSFAGSMKTMADAGMIGAKTAKRFAQVQALVDAYASANAAYKSMAGIPVIGTALAVTAAAAALGAGLANVQMIEKAATGFDGVVDRPTMFMTGEGNKKEHVSVTPLEAPNINGKKGGAQGVGTTVNISGGVVDDDFIRNELIPALNRAISTGSTLNA